MKHLIVPFSPPDVGEAEISAVSEVIRSGWITTGPKTELFEKKLTEYICAPRMCCLSSGTAAEEMNLRLLGIGKGDEVIVPSYTYTATVSAVIHTGAKAVPVDCAPDSYEMDYEKAAALINEKTKAIIAADLFGIPCDYEKIYAIVNDKRSQFQANGDSSLSKRIQKAIDRVIVIADAAHALGAKRNGVHVGQLADFSSFSFHAVKNLTTAEGGASTWRSLADRGIDDEEIYRGIHVYSLHGQTKDAMEKETGSWEYDVIGHWYKCNMTDISAAFGLAQFERYPSMLERRKKLIERYDEMCERHGLYHLSHITKNTQSSCHLYIVRLPGYKEKERNQLIQRMFEAGVACNVHYKPLAMLTAYKKLGWYIEDFPNAYHFYENEITLPLYSTLTDEKQEYVIEKFEELL